MADTITCAVCGGQTEASKKFCKFCGSPVEVTVAAAAASAEPAPEANAPACPHCGAPLKSADQKFCGSCGGVIEKAQPAPAAAPTVAVGGTAPVTVTGAASEPASSGPSTDAMKEGLSKASAKLDDFMGASLDLDAVGKDFNPDDITFSNIDKDEFARALVFFNKTIELSDPTGNDALTEVAGAPAQRRTAEGEEDKAPRSKETRDFSAKAGTAVIGAFSSQLHAEFAPKVDMIAEHRDKAATKEHKDRLKHKVALGDMGKREAVELAEE